MTELLLTRSSHRKPGRPSLPFLGDLELPLARVHEACGPSRRYLASLIAAQLSGPIFWIAPAWQIDRLNPTALIQTTDPGRLVFVEPDRADDLLWCMEESLRDGHVPLVIADLPAPPGLTAVRRLHLAAETGAAAAGSWPLGLLLTPGEGGAQGIETRWQMRPQHAAYAKRAWRLDRTRARTASQKSWHVHSEPAGLRLDPWKEPKAVAG